MPDLTHLDDQGRPRMVDVGDKAVTARTARAACRITMCPQLISSFEDGDLKTKKGSVVQTATVAGIMAVKQTSNLIPMCHPLPLEHCSIDIAVHDASSLRVECTCRVSGKTGVEMEALTGASVAALTVYDMCKAVDPDMTISELQVIEKKGGKSDIGGA